MNAETRRACLVLCGACLFGGTLASAGTVVHDNADLTFVPTPWYYAYTFPIGSEDYLYLLEDAAANAAGTATGVSVYYRMNRFVMSSSQIIFDGVRLPSGSGTDLEFALADTTYYYSNGLQMEQYRPPTDFALGTTVGPTDFDFSGGDATLVAYSELAGSVPLAPDEVTLGWRYTEPGGVRYGFVRLTWTEGVVFPRASGGDYFPIDLYLPTAWGYADTLDEPVTVTLPCPADLDGNGILNLDDINAFASAFVNADLLADIDANGVLNLDDINLFAAAFVAGC